MVRRALGGLGLAAWLAYGAAILLGLHGGRVEWAYQAVPIAVPAISAVVCIDAARRASGRIRLVWLLFGLGALCWAMGDTGYTILDLTGTTPDALLTPADAGYLLLIPLWTAAIILHPAHRGRGLELVGSAIDASTVVIAASALTIAFVLAPILRAADSAAGAIVTLSYPVGDLALIAVSVAFVMRVGVRRSGGGLLIAAAVGTFAVADIVYARLALAGTYDAGSPVDLVWELGFLMLAVASRRRITVEAGPARPQPASLLSVAGLAGVAALVGIGLLGERTILFGGAAAAGLLLATRQTLFLVENRRLVGALARSVEDLKAAALARERFIATVSHDLRSPLNAIGGFARMLRHPHVTTSSERVLEFADTIGRNAERLRWLVEDLLLAGQYAAGVGPSVSAHTVDLLEIATRTANDLGMVDRVAVEGRATLAVGDPRRIQQILTNLYDNALKHGVPGTKVSVDVGSVDGVPQVAVTDNGPGIAKDRIDEIFRPFVGFGSQPASIGLGLFIVRSLVEAMHGSVVCTSEPGHGATFRVTFPPDASRVPADHDG